MSIHCFARRLAGAFAVAILSTAPVLAWDFPEGRWGGDRDNPGYAVVGVTESQSGNQAMTGCIANYPFFVFNIPRRSAFDDIIEAAGLYLVMTVDPFEGGRTLWGPAVTGIPESGFLPVGLPSEKDADAFRKAAASAKREFTLGVVFGKPPGNWTSDPGARNIATFQARGSTAAIAGMSRLC